METIDYNELVFKDYDHYGKGSFGVIKICYLDGKKFAYKEFSNYKYLNGKRRKLELLSEINEPGLYTPKYWVKKDGYTDQYLTYFFDGKDIGIASDEDYNVKLLALKRAKKEILKMHKYGIIHSDLIDSNILYNKDNVGIIDFDNSSFGRYKTNSRHSNDYAQEFMKIFGIIPEIDIHIFNLITFYIMNSEASFHFVRRNILLENYGFFNNPDGIRICESLLLNNDTPNNDFLIDTIDETTFTL